MTTRRSFFTEQGEPLIVSPSPVQAAIRFGTWVDFTGASSDAAMVSPMSSIPLPLYPEHWEAGSRRWPGTRPEAMWHPLMWLPPKLAGRYSMAGKGDQPRIESDDLWAVRLVYELMTSGLYDEDTGSWLDILSIVDINIDVPEDLDRVERWLAGGADEALDSIDLAPVFAAVGASHGDPEWALNLAAEEMASLRIIAWATSADSLLDHCEDLTDESGGNVAEMRKGAGLMAALAGVAFAQMPGGPAADQAEWWAALSDQIEGFTGSARELADGPMETMVGQLMEIRENYWPRMEQMAGPAA